jgi:ubiquinone/menaquinone biosynthesis C-methylase UbiE
MGLSRVLEPEVMDTLAEARDYDAMDHAQVNQAFVTDFLAFWPGPGKVLDVGTGTAQIPMALCRRHSGMEVDAVDLAATMIEIGSAHVRRAGLDERIRLHRADAKNLPWPAGSFAAVISNSIVHHIPEPIQVLAEMARVAAPSGVMFVRDLLRPESDSLVRRLVDTYAAGANEHQRAMFDASLRAALTLAEIRDLVASLGFDAGTVRQSSDRHWTWAARRADIGGPE